MSYEAVSLEPADEVFVVVIGSEHMGHVRWYFNLLFEVFFSAIKINYVK